MNQSRKVYLEHPLHEKVLELVQFIKDMDISSLDDEQRSTINRISTVIAHLLTLLKVFIPECTTRSFLDSLSKTCSDCLSNLKNFQNTKSVSFFRNANSNIDLLIQSIPTYTVPKTATAITENISVLTNVVENSIAALSTKEKEINSKVDSLLQRISQNEEKLKQTDSSIETQKTRLDKAISDYQSQFSSAEAERRNIFEAKDKEQTKSFQTLKETITTSITTFLSEKREELSSFHDTHSTDATKIIDEMKARRDEAVKVLNISANIGVTGDYDRFAQDEKRVADWFRGFAIAFMGIIVIGAILTVLSIGNSMKIDWHILAMRYATTLVLSIPAFYCAKESTKHRRNEVRYRKMQLELASIDPYLILLEKKDRDEIKVKLSEKFFAQPELQDNEKGADTDSLLSVIKQLISVFEKNK